jgi:hypothetical protein
MIGESVWVLAMVIYLSSAVHQCLSHRLLYFHAVLV